MTFKMVKALGKLVVRLYTKEAVLKAKEHDALLKASRAAEEAAATLVSKSKDLEALADKAWEEGVEVSRKAKQLKEFFS